MKNFIVSLFLIFPFFLFSQNKIFTFAYKKEQLTKVLYEVEEKFDVKFSYIDANINDKSIDLEKGTYNLSQMISFIKKQTGLFFYEIDSRYFAISKKEDIQVDNIYANALKEIIIHGYLTRGISKQQTNFFRIYPKKLGLLPGLTEPDILQTLQQLPGVISPNETATGLNVKGGTPDQNLVLWDGITMYHNGHLFGMISGFNPNIVDKVDFYDKGISAKYGGRVSSVIDIQTSDKIPDKTRIQMGVNALNADMGISIPLIKNKLSVQLSGRRSFTDLYKTYTYKKLADKVFQNTKITEDYSNDSFYFQDFTTKINYNLSKKDQLFLSAILIDNNLNNHYSTKDEGILFQDILNVYNVGYSAKWQRQWHDDFSQSLRLYYSKYRLNYDFNKDYGNDDYDLFIKKNKILDSGFSFDNKYYWNKKNQIKFGYQLSSYDVSYAFMAKNPTLNFILDANTAFVQTHSVYAAYHYKVKQLIDVELGLRYNYYSKFKKTFFEPRINLNYSISDRINVNFSAELKNQIISQIKETVVSDLNLENQLWVLSDIDKFPIINAKQATSGIIYTHNHWTLDLDAYLKRTTGLTTLTSGFLNTVNPGFHIGESYAKGIDFYVKKDLNNLTTWLTYSFNSTKNRFDGINDNLYFPYNSEIKHSVNFSIAYKIKKFQIATGWYWRTGRPFTQAILEGTSIEYDQLNGKRLPNYHRLDLSSMYSFSFNRNSQLKGKVGFSIYNLYNKRNFLSRQYDTGQSLGSDTRVLDIYSLQLTPNIFLRINL